MVWRYIGGLTILNLLSFSQATCLWQHSDLRVGLSMVVVAVQQAEPQKLKPRTVVATFQGLIAAESINRLVTILKIRKPS